MNHSLSNRYSAKARHFHWTVAALVILAYSLILSTDIFPRSTGIPAFLLQSHFWAGIGVFLLAFPRLIERLRHLPPPVSPPLHPKLELASRITHWALYAFLFAQPLLGIMTVWLSNGAIPVPGTSLAVPSPFGVTPHLGHSLESIHKTLGTAFYYVIGLHIAAVLWHQFVRRDDLLKRMW
ncbi:cytochrome b [Salinicola sp. LHM]|uniref:cytochrome b n=1 Tax=Salinicola sp. LHM TaxID=3065298 RepID=UPI002ACDC802|nr:cytochrome b [Salinicola sp. LHM]MEC8918313.1 cytochrome b [Pseudomonadota bacterium]MED5500377.1 cytochrome b [Pseudomonadota bacterium]WQH33206.1 cytochrome b [Salinicola sp. LHM]